MPDLAQNRAKNALQSCFGPQNGRFPGSENFARLSDPPSTPKSGKKRPILRQNGRFCAKSGISRGAPREPVLEGVWGGQKRRSRGAPRETAFWRAKTTDFCPFWEGPWTPGPPQNCPFLPEIAYFEGSGTPEMGIFGQNRAKMR